MQLQLHPQMELFRTETPDKPTLAKHGQQVEGKDSREQAENITKLVGTALFDLTMNRRK